MTRKQIFITIISLAALILIVGAGYLFIRFSNSDTATGLRESLFPSDSPAQTVGEREDADSLGDTGLENEAEVYSSGFQKLTPVPIAGFVILSSEDGLVIRYVERETGHVFEISSKSSTATRLTNTTIPRIQEALWAPDGKQVALRYLGEDRETIETFLATVEPTEDASEEGTLEGAFLPENITALDINNAGLDLFYLHETTNGSEGRRISLSNKQDTLIFNHPLKEWQLNYVDNNRLLFVTKPAAGISGYAYLVSNTTGVFTQILQRIPGLTAHISPDRETMLYSESGTSGLFTRAFTFRDKETVTLPLKTLPEKCAWSAQDAFVVYCAVPQTFPSGNYPDAWYQGRVSFSDDIWEINTNTGETRLLLNIKDVAREEVDVIHPNLSEDESLLVFINKKDSSLWSFSLPPLGPAEDISE